MTDVHCTICQGDHTRKAFSLRGYDIFKCMVCDFAFVYPPPSASELDTYYSSPAYYEKSIAERGRIEWDINRRLLILERLFPQKGRLLDVGCAAGFFLSAAKASGWEVLGVEQSHHTAKEAIDLVGERVLVATLEQANISGPFDVVCLWEVIEHSQDPFRLLQKAASLLARGGILCLSTPNLQSVLAKIMGRRFPALMPPEHLGYFSIKPLKHIFSQLNLKKVKMSSFSNIAADEFYNGVVKYYIDSDRLERSKGLTTLVLTIGMLVAPLMKIVDLGGLGTEMEVYLTKDFGTSRDGSEEEITIQPDGKTPGG